MHHRGVHRIAITGTESTGKTTLADALSAQLSLPLVPDVSREYIGALNRPYTEADVLEIGRQIIEREEAEYQKSGNLFLSDNDLINIKIWLKYYGWAVPDWLEARILNHPPTLYLLCYPDVPWVADEQRANPLDRDNLYSSFVLEIEAIKAPYGVLRGDEQERFLQAKALVEKFL
jgi:nicotinamide riboside kinase